MKIILLFLLLAPFAVRSQKEAEITIILPHTVNKQQLGIDYYNGKKRKNVDVAGNSDSIVIRDTCYAQHLVLFMHCRGAKPYEGYGAVFYIKDRPATIRLQVTEANKNIFSNVQVKNAVNATSLGFEQMYQYVSKEQELVNAAYEKVMAAPTNDALKDSCIMLAGKQTAKQFQYIRNHRSQYYSFFIFLLEYINSKQFPIDSLISIFHSFPLRYKNSWEGKQAIAYHNIRKLREQKHLAPDFSFQVAFFMPGRLLLANRLAFFQPVWYPPENLQT